MKIINKINTYKKRIAKIVGYDLIEEVDYRYITLFIKIFRDFNIEGVEFEINYFDDVYSGHTALCIAAIKNKRKYIINTFEMSEGFDVEIGLMFNSHKNKKFDGVETIDELKQILTDYFNE